MSEYKAVHHTSVTGATTCASLAVKPGDRVVFRSGVFVVVDGGRWLTFRPYRWTDRVVDTWRGFCRTLGQWFGP